MNAESEPLLPSPVTQPGPSSPTTLRSKLARRPLSEKSKGKQRQESTDDGEQPPQIKGRHVTVIFSGEDSENLELWVENDESVGGVKEQIRHLRPSLAQLSLRLIHSGRLLTDGILLLPWLRSLEERVRRQAGGMGGDVEDVLKDVGLATPAPSDDRVWLHCNVGRESAREENEESTIPRRRGFDVLLDAGLSAEEVAQMRRQFYESRGEEVPEGLGNDEHAQALEEQWIEGDMTADTATTSTEGMYTSILHGALTGFLYPIMPFFFFREPPLPNFFDADAEAAGEGGVSGHVASNAAIGGEIVSSVVFGRRVQMGILLGTVLNLAFGVLRFLD